MRSRISIFKSFIPLYQVSILPNRNNHIHIHIPAEKNSNRGGDLRSMENNGEMLDCLSPCLFPCGTCAQMESKIVKYSMQLLEKKRCDEAEESEKEALLSRLRKMENMLTELLNNKPSRNI